MFYLLNDAIFYAKLIASSTSFSGACILLTRPYFSAVIASINSPVSYIYIALDFPTALINLYVPPHPGIVPNVISGNPNYAF